MTAPPPQTLPVLGLMLGDATGIGPEQCARILADRRMADTTGALEQAIRLCSRLAASRWVERLLAKVHFGGHRLTIEVRYGITGAYEEKDARRPLLVAFVRWDNNLHLNRKRLWHTRTSGARLGPYSTDLYLPLELDDIRLYVERIPSGTQHRPGDNGDGAVAGQMGVRIYGDGPDVGLGRAARQQ
jgi:hypothetical protein